MKFNISFLTTGLKAQCAANPDFPRGKDVDLSTPFDADHCKVELPYPAECIGTWLVRCERCGLRVGVTAAGRRDDPRSVTLPCHHQRGTQ